MAMIQSLRATPTKRVVQNFALLTAGAVLAAINVNLFLAPSDIAPGGVIGAAIVLNTVTGWPIGLTMLLLNVPLTILGFRYLGRYRFLVYTLYTVLLYSTCTDLFSRWLPAGGLTEEVLLNALYGGVVGGVATGLIYSGGGTAAGTGVLARILQIKTGVPVSQIYLLTDGAVILGASLVFGWEAGLYALISVFVWGLAADFVLEGPSVVRVAFVVTDAPDRVADALMRELRLGVTAWPAQGMFTEADHAVLFCTVSRPQARELRRVVAHADPKAFLVVGHGHQARGGVFGRPMRRPVKQKDQAGEAE
jgi:uncharacterized membrane-anchored protein YitT (DUF2179 family)